MNQEPTQQPSDTPPPTSHAGLMPRLAAGLLVILIIAGFAIFGPGRRGKPSVPALAPPPASAEVQALQDELAELGDLFGQMMENDRDAQPLIGRIDALIAQHPDLAEAHTLRGQTMLYSRQLEPALESFEKSLTLNPEQPGIHRLAGTVAAQLGRLELAVEHYQKALDLEPQVSNHAVFLANAQHKLGRSEDAIQTLTAAIRHDSQLHPAYALLSDIYGERDKPKLALDQIDRALEALPADQTNTRIAYVLKRANLLRELDQPAESLAELDRLPPQAQLRPDVLRDTALSWEMLGKPAMAAERYERLLTIDPTNDHAAAEAAKWRLKAGDPKAAERNLQTLRRINPRHPDIPELNKAINNASTSPLPDESQ